MAFAMRTLEEIGYRLRQELRNLRLAAAPPKPRVRNGGFAFSMLPDPVGVAARLRATSFQEQVEAIARQVLDHRFPIFDSEVTTGEQIDWTRDYRTGTATGRSYFRFIPYLDVNRSGDHKWIWELNRHQHLVVLAQAFLFSSDSRYVAEIESELSDWLCRNPFGRGINWASALEVAFRSISWLWVLHLAGGQLSSELLDGILQGIYLHGVYLENNLSFYFSPNTHLLGEAVALHAIGAVMTQFPESSRWCRKASSVIEEQMRVQVRGDGSHFEQSTYYHVYALDMFLFHAVVSNPSEEYRSVLTRMAGYLNSLLGHDRRLPFLGDDDGGRWFHPYGDRATFGRGSLAACNAYFGGGRWLCDEADYWPMARWWLSAEPLAAGSCEPVSRFFRDAGRAVLRTHGSKLIIDCGQYGRGSAGHTHSACLSLVATIDDEEILIDPGTYTYVGNIHDRNHFRGTDAHNTVRVDGRDQADPAGPFRWENAPTVSVLRFETSVADDVVEAECSYRGFQHRRYLRFLKPYAILVADTITGDGTEEHVIEQFWHLGSVDAASRFTFSDSVHLSEDWRSRCFGRRERAPVLRVSVRRRLPVVLAAAICLDSQTRCEIESDGPAIRFRMQLPCDKKQLLVNYTPELR
jgi:hypothetical protein